MAKQPMGMVRARNKIRLKTQAARGRDYMERERELKRLYMEFRKKLSDK